MFRYMYGTFVYNKHLIASIIKVDDKFIKKEKDYYKFSWKEANPEIVYSNNKKIIIDIYEKENFLCRNNGTKTLEEAKRMSFIRVFESVEKLNRKLNPKPIIVHPKVIKPKKNN